jgi:xylulokinase
MYLGIDIGTSSLKAVLMDGKQRILGSRSADLEVSRPHPGLSEQDPESWWTACLAVLDDCRRPRRRWRR